jgi:uncharacterized tellurite resistance protein B-like protein
MIQGIQVTPEELAKIGDSYDFRIALAALLAHTGNIDGRFVEPERRHIRVLLAEQFGISAIDASELMILSDYKMLQHQEVEELVATLAETLGPEGRVYFVEWLWQVVIADRIVAPEEANLIDALAAKLGVAADAQAAIAVKYTTKPQS